MIRDEDLGFVTMARSDAFIAPTNPFDAVRERLAVAYLAIRDLHAQVIPNHLLLHFRSHMCPSLHTQCHCIVFVFPCGSDIVITCMRFMSYLFGNVPTQLIFRLLSHLHPSGSLH